MAKSEGRLLPLVWLIDARFSSGTFSLPLSLKVPLTVTILRVYPLRIRPKSQCDNPFVCRGHVEHLVFNGVLASF